MKSKIILSLTTVALFVSVSVFARGGQHNDKACYVTLNDGSSTSSPCSARGTSCLDDFSCTIDGIPGIGTHKNENLSARKIIKSEAPLGPTKEILVEEGKAQGKSQDYNSSRSNRTTLKDKPDEIEKKIKRCLEKNKKLNRADCLKDIK